MRNALLLLSLWVGILVAAYGLVYWDQGIERPLPISVLEQEEPIVSAQYVHPDGAFEVPIPTEWTTEEIETAVRLIAPDEGVDVWLLKIEGDDPEAAVGAAWTIVDPDLLLGPASVEELDPPDGVERSIRTSYEGPDEAAYGVARLFEGAVVVLLVRGDREAVEAHADDLAEIENGLAVPAAETTLL